MIASYIPIGIEENPISFRITFDPEKSDVDEEYAEKCKTASLPLWRILGVLTDRSPLF